MYHFAATLLAIYIAALGFGWYHLTSGGGFAIKPSHVVMGALAVVGAVLALTRSLGGFRHRAEGNAPSLSAGASLGRVSWFVGAYSCYLMFMGVATAINRRSDVASIIKCGVYFLVFLLLFSVLRNLQRKSSPLLASSLYLGGIMGILGYAGMCILTFALLGRNFPWEFLTALAQGDTLALQFGIPKTLFNTSFDGVLNADQSADYLGATLRNTLMGALLMQLIVVLMCRAGARRLFSPRVESLLTWFSVGMAVIFIVGSVSRSNVLAMCLCFAVAGMVRAFRGRVHSGAVAITGIFCVAALGVVLVFAWEGKNDAVSKLAERLDISSDGRIENFTYASRGISERWLWGHGTGVTVNNGLRAHNLFLSSWYECGMFTFLASVAFFLLIVIAWGNNMLGWLRTPGGASRPIDPEWLFALPVLPLVRSMVSGEGGNFTLIEWTCLALFYALAASWRSTAQVRSGMTESGPSFRVPGVLKGYGRR